MYHVTQLREFEKYFASPITSESNVESSFIFSVIKDLSFHNSRG